ncbi:MAG: AAA family ATPase [Chloroflexi bacterium]|nr:AAA family ATPase [Chloroflexota bacterium]
MNPVAALPPERLRIQCDPAQFTFKSTADLPDLAGIIGQDRATRALKFGMSLEATGYNIFVLGPMGSGKSTAVRHFIEQDAAKRPPARDWVYLYNFHEPSQPNVLSLPSGRGRVLRDDLEKLLKLLRRTIPEAFESEDYTNARDAIIARVKEAHEKMFKELTEMVEKYSFSLIRLPGGFMLVPAVAGKPITDEQFEQLTDEQKEKLKELRVKLQAQVDKTMNAMREVERHAREEIAQLDERVARFAIEHPIKELKQQYEDLPEVLEHFDAMFEDLVANVEVFKRDDGQTAEAQAAMRAANSQGLLRRYSINLFVDNAEAKGAPVIYETNPNFANLVGRIEHQAVMGALFTDFTMIRPGALHRANGGYLVLDAMSLLQRPQSWDALKRTLKEGQVRVEEYAQSLGLISTAVLEPEPIPIDLKVVLSGSTMLFYLLQTYDEDFDELFKVQADFDDRMERSEKTLQEYAQFIATLCRNEDLKHFSPDGVARVVDYSTRLVSDQKHLSTRFRDLADLLTEASYWADQAGHDLVLYDDVQKAIDEKRYRASRYQERLQEAIARGQILISVKGQKVGQINGLSVIDLGNYVFGRPSRITARTALGRGGVVDIERQVKLGGPIHSKGVLILSAFLSGRYAQEKPLSLRASLVFEQSYAGVEGDSASLAELCVLLSAIANLPLRQDLALTGSINQHGDVQPIGGVNEKVEGFFDACRLLGGLTGTQGVILPQANVEHLMLRDDVVDAVAAGQFHLYPVASVDEALELLTGLPRGEADEEGHYPLDSINGRVFAALEEMHARLQALKGGEKEDEEGTEEEDGEEDDAG